ncbi:Transcriptional regulator GlxA family, contains an amidase domain and an AraC-type DNA-binding HTH domain [Zhouia amylolytica]|uniref:Transcriptional regulator GlxA family, contains an amidase domain and an AraC-type DNA-binding HTH domain n=1 Tax=Zhouia amylolytica TaxID=376730 RepID=A0A1I6S6M6_9FLAO|nr:helix-turn-helix domain-containing protein [Zhouia amylolytica]MCQ0110995.1 helix-turn-helix domain-containing protein [Zhouia amylolytica]SFS72582.1 Transcriptional regulator GlxA family, contains an amidase domain and an AraC-type DNA-binding HTH domain [Zhouia amylolytica]
MKRVSIFTPETAVPSAVSGPRYVFTTANQFLRASGKPPLFDVKLVGCKKEVKLQEGVFTVSVDQTIDQVTSTDLVIIPALFGDMKKAVALNKDAIPWIVEQHTNGAEIASLCVGAFLLAASGLLDGKKCSTHWAYYNEFQHAFPQVELAEGCVITEDAGIYSSGGANSLWNLLLYLLEKYTDRDTAILASKYFAIDIDRNSQSAFTIFKGQKEHNDNDVLRIQEYLEKNYKDKITIDELADLGAMSRRSFERRFKKATKNTAIEYLQRVKIEAAKRDFESTRKNVNDVMYDVGYTDSKAFRTVFKRLTGLTPIAYRNKYSKM